MNKGVSFAFSFLLLIFQNNILSNNNSKKYALIVNPIANLYSHSKKKQHMRNLVHQDVFNEVVKVIDEDKDEALVETPQVYYQTDKNGTKNHSFWIAKKNMIDLNLVSNELDKIPEPINFNKLNINSTKQKILTLAVPFNDNITQKKYSAGTRFVYKNFDAEKEQYQVYVLDPTTLTFKLTTIFKNYCLTNEHKAEQTQDQQITNFVKLIRKWATPKNGYIVYLLGGCSFNHLNHNNFEKDDSGIDCSGLVVRASQICGIPFYYKNSTTIVNNLDQLNLQDNIENGDLIWIQGHIIIISDVENSLCVEARGFSCGYGKVHEISLNKLFKGINTFLDLKRSFLDNKPLLLLDINGRVAKVIPNFKILKLKSVWKE